MPESPKRTCPNCPYSSSQLELIKLQRDDRVALCLGIFSESEIVSLSPEKLSDTLEVYRRFVQDKNLRDRLNEADADLDSLVRGYYEEDADLDSLVRGYYEDGPIS